MSKILKKLSVVISLVLVMALVATGSGCGAKCQQTEQDWNSFFAREGEGKNPHVEMIVPFRFAERLIDRQVETLDPFPIDLPVGGSLSSYFGKFTVQVKSVELQRARAGRVGFKVDFYVRNNGERIFTMGVETEVKPKVDLQTGEVTIGLTPESFGDIKPKLSRDAKAQLGGLIWSRIPRMVRNLVPRSAVDNAAAAILKKLVSEFYKRQKNKLLARLGVASTMAIDLPDIPAKKLTFDSYQEHGGGLRLLFYSGLPIETGIDPKKADLGRLPKKQISVRMSGSAVAELTNWAIKTEKVPGRYNRKGKPKEDGEFRPGLAWVPGKRPMKVYLWQLERPCKRITIGTNPTVSVKNDKIQIETKGTEIEDVEATAITELGIWFVTLWKDAVDVRKSAAAEMHFTVAGKKMVTKIERASIENDELTLGISLKKAN